MNAPPFLVSFSDLKSLRASLGVGGDPHWNELERLVANRLPPAVSVHVLSCLFGFSPRFVGALRRKPERYYRTFTLPKGKSSERRTINAPKVALKVIQKWFSYHLAAAINTDDAVFGFVSGRSAPLAANVHAGATWVFSFDLQNFFPSTSKVMVVTALEALGYPFHGASLIADICCYMGNLAQGSPASPVLSNLVFGPTDAALRLIASEAGARYTRYADDIVFSGRLDPPPDLESRVRDVIVRAGWLVADRKVKLMKLPQQLKVHGLLVHGPAARLPKGYRNQLRAYSHLSRAGKVISEDQARLNGHLAYGKSVEALAAFGQDGRAIP